MKRLGLDFGVANELENSLTEALPLLGVSTADIKAAEAEALELAARYEGRSRRSPAPAHRTAFRHGLPGHASIDGMRAGPPRL